MGDNLSNEEESLESDFMEMPIEILEKKYIELAEEQSIEVKFLKKKIEIFKLENIKEIQETVKVAKALEECRHRHSTQEEDVKSLKNINTNNQELILTFEQKIEKHIEIVAVQDEELQQIRHELTMATMQISKQDTILENREAALVLVRQEYQNLEAKSLQLQKNIAKEEQKTKKSIEDFNVFKNENKILHERIKKLKLSETPSSIRALKSQQIHDIPKVSIVSTGKIEYLLEELSYAFKEHEFSYMYFEMLIYVLSSQKGMSDIEALLKKSKVLSEIIDFFYFKGDLILKNERSSIFELVKHIKGYEKNNFSHKIKMNINVGKEMPKTLIFDRIKIQSILLHLLMDLHQFVDHENDILVDISLEGQYLQIKLGGAIHQKNNLFNTMFKQSKLALNNKERVGLQLSRKIIERLKGKIDFSYEDAYYKFILTVPVQVLKL